MCTANTAWACGKCVECRLSHSVTWQTRLELELMKTNKAVFITLTYEPGPDGVPRGGWDLDPRDLNRFIRKARKTGLEFKYFAVGDYGERSLRKHFHAIFFGLDLEDLGATFFKRTLLGTMLYRSERLTALWTHGWANLSEASFRSFQYIASYTLNAVVKRDYFEEADLTVKSVARAPIEEIKTLPFLRCSQDLGMQIRDDPALLAQVLRCGYILVDGQKRALPRGWKNYLRDAFPDWWEKHKIDAIEDYKKRPPYKVRFAKLKKDRRLIRRRGEEQI